MKRGLIYGTIIAGLLIALRWGCDRRVDNQIGAPVLGPDDRAKIILDQRHHTVTRVDSEGSRKTFLNPHGPVSIVEKKDGRTVLIQRTWGTQLSPFAGATLGSDFKFRAAIGVNYFYIQRWETGAGLMIQPGDVRDVRLFAHVGYNVYGNWILSAAVDHKQTVHILAGLRF